MSDSVLHCEHCQLPIPPRERVSESFAGEERYFCCRGCLGAFRIITGAGLEKFYRQRHWDEAGPAAGAFETDYQCDVIADMVLQEGDDHELSFMVEGIRCASCVWLIEKILLGLDGVQDARVNYGTHRIRVRFDPELTEPATILARIGQLGYRPRPLTAKSLQEAGLRERRALLIRFGTAAFLSMQLMGYSLALYAGYFQGIDPTARQVIQYFAAGVTTPVVFYAGWPFLAGAWRSLKNLAPNMDLLVALGVLTAYLYSLIMLASGGEVYFDSAAMIVTLVLLGRLLEATARRQASEGIDRLLQMAPERARRLGSDGREEIVDPGLLGPGDLVLVGPGERFPADGALAEGETEIDESIVTGEPLPVLRAPGDSISSGALNISTSVTLRVNRSAEESFIARVARLVEAAQARRAPVQAAADRVAAWFVPFVVLLAAATCLYWLRQEVDSGTAVLHAIAVLVVACPCALGLATPTAILVATGTAARGGILFRGGDVLEQAAKVDLIAFDKTGTLTAGTPSVSRILAAGCDETDLLATAATLEAGTRHPIARGILAEAARRGLDTTPRHSVTTVPGAGLRLEHAGRVLLAGSVRFLEAAGIVVPSTPAGSLTEIHLARDDRYLGAIQLQDRTRPEAARAMASLQAAGYRTCLLTGDPSGAGSRLAAELKLELPTTGLSPQQKADWLSALQSSGVRVMMVGDGINDAPALATADVGCAMAGGTDIALETSDIILTRPDLGKLALAMRLARRTLRIIKQNLFWAFTYNLVAIPLAMTGRLAPVWAAAAMAASSVLVVSNSLRLARSSPAPEHLGRPQKDPAHA